MKRFAIIIYTIMLTTFLYGQHMVYGNGIHTLQVCLNGNPLLPPVLTLGKSSQLNISWDEMSHDYHRYIYRIQHCTWDWQENQELFESDFLQGTNDLPVEDYETSFNTTQIYTHYSLDFPNQDATVLLSGNYKLLVFEDGYIENGPVIEVRFYVAESGMRLTTQVSANTDIDFNDKHQQVSMSLSYGTTKVNNPNSQIQAVVIQNSRTSRTVSGVRPNIIKGDGLEWQHREELIFPAGNEYHKFEILNVSQSGMNVDHMRWFDPYYHATLWTDQVPASYISNKDHNGAFIPRTEDQDNNNTQAEYVVVHFALSSPPLDQDVYINGKWSNGELDSNCLMHYNEELKLYEATLLLKQGYYEYSYITSDGSTLNTMGDFWQTENEYQTFIYYRETGGRYDRLIAYSRVNTGF